MAANQTAPATGETARTVLFLVSDTGGGHRRAAEAVVGALTARYPGQFRPVLCDPLAGPATARPLRWLARLYGPVVRRAPWAWGAAYHLTNSKAVMAVFWRTVFVLVNRPVRQAVATAQPAVIVSCHPLTGRAAALAAPRIPLITLVTDLVSVHVSWRHPGARRVAVATAHAGAWFADLLPDTACADVGLPVAVGTPAGSLAADRSGLRRRLGVADGDFLVLLAGGAEGCGGLARRARAIVRAFPAARVVVICGRNEGLRRRLSASRNGGQGNLTVLGFVTNMGDWLRCADVVVTKAGPGMIAEAACCATPMLLTSHLPGQERGNCDLVTRAGAGRAVRSVSATVRVIGELARDPAALALLRAGSRALARPSAAADVAGLIAAQAPTATLAAGREDRVLANAAPR